MVKDFEARISELENTVLHQSYEIGELRHELTMLQSKFDNMINNHEEMWHSHTERKYLIPPEMVDISQVRQELQERCSSYVEKLNEYCDNRINTFIHKTDTYLKEFLKETDFLLFN